MTCTMDTMHAYISEQDYPDTYPDAYDAYVSARSPSGATHGIDTPLEDLEVFRSKQANAPRRPYRGPNSQLSIDRETWNKLEKPHQALWDQFPPHVKNMILSNARQRGIDSIVNRRPVVPDKNDKTPPINKASSANFRPGLTGNLHETDDTPPIQENLTHEFGSSNDPDQHVDNSDELDRSLFINMAKSHVSPSDIRAVLSSSLNKQPPKSALKTGKYSVSFHSLEDPHHVPHSFWNRHTLRQCFCFILGILFLVYSALTPKTLDHDTGILRDTVIVTKHQSTSARGALVDRGANGGIAGNDVKILSYTDRVINVTGIDNHQLTDIRIGTVAAHTVSQRGPVIIIMHQYAVYQTNRTIHSCVQLEHFKNIVDDRSIKAGGKQRITTHDGYVFPLDIVNGLPFLKMRIPSDKELNTLPHVILTSDMPFEYSTMDCTISDKPDWYDNISNWHEGILDSPFDLVGEYKHMDKEYDLNLHLLHDLNYPWDVSSCFDLDANAAIQHLPSKPNYEELRPYFLNAPANVVMHTLDATTQFARHIQSGPEMHKTHRSPFPACNVRRRNEAVATDTVSLVTSLPSILVESSVPKSLSVARLWLSTNTV